MDTTLVSSPDNRVICLGEILFDCLADRVGKPWNKVESWTLYPGGAPANTACALIKLGTKSAFIGCIGKDPQGEKLVNFLDSSGVNVEGVQRNSVFPTRQVYVERGSDGSPSFVGFGKLVKDKNVRESRKDVFADAYLQKKELPEKLFSEAEYLVLGTLGLAYPETRSAVFHALELADKYYLKVLLDVNWRSIFWENQETAISLIESLWEWIDFIKLTKDEAIWLFGTKDAKEIAYKLDSVEGVLISDGEARVNYYINDYQGSIDPFSVKVVDTTGAGDCFVGGFIHQLCKYGIQALNNPKAIEQMVRYACAVGSLSTTKFGAISSQPTASEVDAFLKQNSIF